MQRYFVDQNHVDLDQRLIIITGDDVGHIVKVMRSSVGDPLICCDGTGKCYLAEISRMDKQEVICKIKDEQNRHRELPVHVTVAQGMPKGDKMEMVIQKGTELGAHCFIPFVSSRTIVQLDAKKESKRLERWGKIAKEAAEQAHREILPSVESVHSWQQLLQKSKEFDLALIAYENELTRTIHEKLQGLAKNQRILLIVGPEGGFSEKEIQEASDYGLFSVMLGKRILRTETAPLYGLSCISYYFEQLQ